VPGWQCEFAKEENSDLWNYMRDTHEYSVELKRLIGPFNVSILKEKVKEVESVSKEKCPRVCKRSEPLMVKWLYQRRQHIRTPQPAATPAVAFPAEFPEAPVVIGWSAVDPIDANDQLFVDANDLLFLDGDFAEADGEYGNV
jgi:hypothetical protein